MQTLWLRDKIRVQGPHASRTAAMPRDRRLLAETGAERGQTRPTRGLRAELSEVDLPVQSNGLYLYPAPHRPAPRTLVSQRQKIRGDDLVYKALMFINLFMQTNSTGLGRGWMPCECDGEGDDAIARAPSILPAVLPRTQTAA